MPNITLFWLLACHELQPLIAYVTISIIGEFLFPFIAQTMKSISSELRDSSLDLTSDQLAVWYVASPALLRPGASFGVNFTVSMSEIYWSRF